MPRYRFWLAAVLGLWMTQAAAAVQQVEIREGEMALRAVLFRPEGAGPFPAVVALHGCAGLVNAEGTVLPQYHDWGERLASAGYAVLFPDSFGSRKAGSQCRISERRVRPRFERVRDANAARHWLQAQDWVIKERVSLLGWANGGSSVLWAIRPQRGPRERHGDFRSAIAFYPGCTQSAKTAWSARLPTLILIGAADDWTPAKICRAIVEEARGRSAQVELVTYPQAHHGFDQPDVPLRVLNDLPLAPTGRAHVGTEPTARADAIRRVLEWLGR